jgi:hypothetical protein
MQMKTDQVIKVYYFATPLFLILELAFGFDFRVNAYISDPKWRFFYYLFCFVCMIAIAWRPKFTIAVGILECSTNLIILFVGTAVSWMFPFTAVSPDTFEVLWVENPVTITNVISFLLVGSLWILCFRRQVSMLKRAQRNSKHGFMVLL